MRRLADHNCLNPKKLGCESHRHKRSISRTRISCKRIELLIAFHYLPFQDDLSWEIKYRKNTNSSPEHKKICGLFCYGQFSFYFFNAWFLSISQPWPIILAEKLNSLKVILDNIFKNRKCKSNEVLLIRAQ